MVSQDLRAFPPAPLSDSSLAAALRPFGESRMLPPAAYTSAEVFAWERRALLRRRLDVRGARVAAARGRRPAGRRDRGGRRGHRARRGRDHQGVRQHLPAPRSRAAALRRGSQARGRAPPDRGERAGHRLPVPLVGVLAVRASCAARRDTAGWRAATGRCGNCPPPNGTGWSSSTGPGARPGRCRCPSSTRSSPPTSHRGWSSPPRTRTTRRRTGRSSPRTTTSATTAPPSTPSCAACRRRTAGRTTSPPAPGSAAGWSCGTAPPRCRSTGTATACRCAGWPVTRCGP